MTDLLGGRAATADTAVLGHYTIPLAAHQVSVRRYHVPVPTEEGSNGHLKRGEVLERAWREINASAGFWPAESEERDEAAKGEGEACAVIEFEKNEAVLWVFTTSIPDTKAAFDLSNLEVMGEEDLLDVRKLVTCSIHGNDLECLGYERKCEIKWTPGSMEQGWKMFARGLVEKKAWREGSRISTASPFKCDLWPMASGKLLLDVDQTRDKAVANTTGKAYIPVVNLTPLDMAAIQVGQFTPTPAQEAILEMGFAQALGAGMMPTKGGWGMDIDFQLGFGHSKWGVYWICSDLQHQRYPSLDELKGKIGTMVIWPSHLVDDPNSDQVVLGNRQEYDKPTPAFSFPPPDSLMDVASGLYDFYSSYNPPTAEPDLSDITPETDGPDHIDQDEEGAPSPTSPRRSSGHSDMDDLFGDHSPTPPVRTFPAANETGLAQGGLVDDGMGLFDMPDLGEDIVMASPPGQEPDEMNLGPTISRPIRGMEEEGEGAFVTEDDFAFFDSPNDETVKGTDEFPGDSVAAQADVVLDNEAQLDVASIPNAAEEPINVEQELPANEDIERHEDPRDVRDADRPASPSQLQPDEYAKEVQPGSEVSAVAASPIPLPSVDVPTIASRKTVTFEQIPLPPSPPLSVTELVPSPFGPLPISPTIPSFTYALPSPAPSPETYPPLRADLVERLASKTKTKNTYDYASGWDIESDPSEMDEEEEYSGAPPTPVSFMDTDEQISSATTPKTDSRSEAADVEWDGVKLMGSEILSTRWNREALHGTSKAWKDAWAKGRMLPSVSEPIGKARLPEAEYERLVEEVVSNRTLRNFLLADESVSPAQSEDDGTVLADLSEANPVRSLPACQMHVGYSGNVCELSVSVLRYWRQLGVQPVGGRKDISVLVVCDPSEGDVRAARAFLRRTVETYESCMLGTCEVGLGAAARDGIIAIPPSAFVHAIVGLLPSLGFNTVVYVILPSINPGPLATLISELLQAKRSGSETIFTKLIPRSALDVHDTQDIVFEVYDRISRPVQGISLRGIPTDLAYPYVQYPAFTLAPPTPPKPELTLAWPLRSYDVFNRWRIVHCAYGIDQASKKAVGFAIDAQGEGWKSTVVSLGEAGVAGIVEALWGFFKEFAGKASVEYRLAICCVGSISKTELDAWRALIDASKMPGSLIVTTPKSSISSPAIHVPPSVAPIPPATFADGQTRIIDESLSGKSCSLPRIPISLTNGSDKIIPLASFLLNMPTSPQWSTATYHVLVHRSLTEKEDDPVELFAEQYHRMAVLGRMRHGMSDGALPLHAEAVRLGMKSIEQLVSRA